MTGEKDRLTAHLIEVHAALRATIEDADPTLIIHADTGWRVHDVIGHVAVWYRYRVNTVRALQRGETYTIPNYVRGDYNTQQVAQRQDWPFDEILAEWEQGHADLIAALDGLSDGQFQAEVAMPWGDRLTLAEFVERMARHEAEHHQEILAALAD